MALQPRTPMSAAASHQLRQPQSAPSLSWSTTSNTRTQTPASTSSSTNTYYLPTSPMKTRRASSDNYKPKILRTCGSRPACLVNASLTYCGNNCIYAFGGFDQYTDEVYNHVLKLDLNSLQWTLVDNYGDIPGVRMGHTACLWQGDKLLIHGGENEHREYLSDVVIFDLKTATWTQPETRGLLPRGRARHAAVIHDEKLFIIGGLSGADNATLDEICYLDLKTWTWSRSWSFVQRFDHSAWVWGGRIWVFGGLGPDMERIGELWWLDLKSSHAFKTSPEYGASDSLQFASRATPTQRQTFPQFNQPQPIVATTTGYTANSSSIQIRPNAPQLKPVAPGAISSMRFVSGPSVPSQIIGTHFHAYSSGSLLNFVTPAGAMRTSECSLSALELNGLQWQRLAEGPEIFDIGYRWHYCTVNEEGTKAWLLGCAVEPPDGNTDAFEEYLSEILTIDLTKYGLLGNDCASETKLAMGKLPASDRHASSNLSSLGVDLAGMFDQPPESGNSCDFVITGERDDMDEEDRISVTTDTGDTESVEKTASRPIYVHKLILHARWPHFNRVYAAQMAEFHTKKMHIPEHYSVVRAFLYYLYTDSIAKHPEYCPSLDEVAGMLVMSNIYDMPRLRLLCVHRLSRELDVETAATVWERAGVAREDWLRRRAATFCLTYWGRVVRTEGFRRLSRQSMMELCEAIDIEGRVVGGEELEMVGGLGGHKFGVGGAGRPKRPLVSMHLNEEMEDMDGEDDEAMEVT